MSILTWLRGHVRATRSSASAESAPTAKGSGSAESGTSSRTPTGKIGGLKSEQAEELIGSFLPLIRSLNEDGVDYCVVGGLGVLIHAYLSSADGVTLRSTDDADLMFDDSFTNIDFSRSYLCVFTDAADAASSAVVYGDMFGDAGFERFEEDEDLLANCSFRGTRDPALGLDLPNFDAVRVLNGFTLDDLETMTVTIGGTDIVVATPRQLLEMKKRTITLMRATPENTSRLQDFVDAQTLSRIIESEADEHETGNGHDWHDR